MNRNQQPSVSAPSAGSPAAHDPSLFPSPLHRLARWCGGLFAAAPMRPGFSATIPAAPPSLLSGEAYFAVKAGTVSESPKRTWLLEALSERMLRHDSSASWRRLFLDPARQDRIVLEEGQGIVLSASFQDPNAASNANIRSEIAFVARAHHGEIDPWPTADVLLCFQDAAHALDAALDLQQLVGGVRLQVGLAIGARAVAAIEADGSTVRVSLGAVVDRATRVSRMAPAGTVRMEPEVFDLLEDRIRELPRCVVTTEFDATGVEAVSLVMAPRPSEALSTFAGLGSA